MKRNTVVFFLLLPILLSTLIFVSFIYTSPLTIYPDKHQLRFEVFNDRSLEGNSTINKFYTSDTSAAFSYTLKKGYQYPFAGMYLFYGDSSYYPDFTGYNQLDIAITTSTSRTLQCYLTTYEKGITKDSIPITYRQLGYELPVSQKKGRYTIPLEDFKTAAWWYTMFNLSEKDLDVPSLNKVKTIIFSSSAIFPLDQQDLVVVKYITLRKTYTSFFIIVLSTTLLFYIWLGTWVYYKKRISDIPPRVIPYQKLELENNTDQNINKIITYLFQNYTNTELTIGTISREIGLTSRTISDCIQKHFNLSYKQYLNAIRLNESKRLLLESDLNIGEIAFKVGYNNVTHFNRAFRQYTNQAPSDFRQKKQDL